MLLTNHRRRIFRIARDLCLATGLLASACSAFAVTDERERWTRNARVSIDLSSRTIHSQGTTSSLHALGLDYLKVFSTDRGDIGTLTFQPYLLRIDNSPTPPALFSDAHDEALQWRITNFNYTGLARGRFNIRLGHFELPFGLEQIIPTNGTLNQMNASSNTGLKADWGVSINGELPRWEYEIGFMRGGGNKLKTTANGYAVGRIGVPRYRSKWIGLSFLSGELAMGDTLVQRGRLGIDVGLRLENGFHSLLEYSAGKDDGVRGTHFLGELGYTSSNGALVTYAQWRQSRYENPPTPDSPRKSVIGMRYEPTARWSVSVEYQHRHGTDRFPSEVAAQFRVRT